MSRDIEFPKIVPLDLAKGLRQAKERRVAMAEVPMVEGGDDEAAEIWEREVGDLEFSEIRGSGPHWLLTPCGGYVVGTHFETWDECERVSEEVRLTGCGHACRGGHLVWDDRTPEERGE